MPTWKMGSSAAEKAITVSGISRDEIDLIICTTVTPDTLIPSTACLIQKELGMEGCMAFDINCACSGFVYAVDMAQKYIAAGSARNVLVVSAQATAVFSVLTAEDQVILKLQAFIRLHTRFSQPRALNRKPMKTTTASFSRTERKFTNLLWQQCR